ncbi:hypothetical protein [Streptomyces sp. NPDC004291]
MPWAGWRCGGPERVAEPAARARAEDVPLWMARRYAEGPAGPVAVAVDRRLVRVDVFGAHGPVAVAHLFATAFGLGDTTGTARFRSRPAASDGAEPIVVDACWDRPRYSDLGDGCEDNEPGGNDGWGSDGGSGGDSGGSDGGGDGGGGGGGGGGGD